MNYIDFRICLKCENCAYIGNSVICKLNKATLAYIINLSTFDKALIFSSNDSVVENIDEKCPEIIMHYIKCSHDKKIQHKHKIKENKPKKKK